MSSRPSEYSERTRSSGEEERERHLARRSGSASASVGWMLAGLAAVGVGALAVYYFGPDVRRYLKMKSM